jgi:tRNA A-37 threonylcarbamoyl transferase component Bud32
MAGPHSAGTRLNRVGGSGVWREFLRRNGLLTFDHIWALPQEWIDKPNVRGSGWSSVSRHRLRAPNGGNARVILKRQQSYTKKTFTHLLRGISTLRTEAEMIGYLRHRGVLVPEIVYFGESKDQRTALMMLEVASAVPLDIALRERQFRDKHSLIAAAARAVRAMHQARCQHRALFPKHILVDKAAAVYIIDLEKARRKLFRQQCIVRDLDELNRRALDANRTDRMRFFKNYLEVNRLGWREKLLWRRIAKRNLRKRSGKLANIGVEA